MTESPITPEVEVAQPKGMSPLIYGVIGIIVVGGFFASQSMQKKETPPNETAKEVMTSSAASGASGVTSAEKEYTLEEIAMHATKTDCWFAIEGTVYDVTKYIEANKHAGGDAILEGCGKDATTLFNTRPMGSGTPHSDKARGYVKNFKIGMLKN